MAKFTKHDIQDFLNDVRDNSETIILEDASKISELKKIVKARGLELDSRDLGYFSTIWAFSDKFNANGARLPEKFIVKKLPQIIGKPININHDRTRLVGTYIDFKYIAKSHTIIAYGTFFKSYYPQLWNLAKDLFKKKKLSSSFEIWTSEENNILHEDGTYDIGENLEISGGALVYQDKDNEPAFEGADVLAVAQKIADEGFYKDLVFATKKYDNGKIITCKDEKYKIEKAESYSCECLDCKHKFSSSEHCNSSKCPKCGSTKVRRAERPGTGRPDQSPNSEGIIKIKCSNCNHEFEAKTDVHIGCPNCKAVLNREGTMLYPPQIKDFSISCPSCGVNNWLITSKTENDAKIKCHQCTKKYKVKFGTTELPEHLKNIPFVQTAEIRCPQCGKYHTFMGLVSQNKSTINCKKCGLIFPFDIKRAKLNKNISSIEEVIIDKKEENKLDNTGGKKMELNKDEKQEKVVKSEETKVDESSEVKASEQEAPKSEETTVVKDEKVVKEEALEKVEDKKVEEVKDEKVEETKEEKISEPEKVEDKVETKDEQTDNAVEKYPKTKILRKAISKIKELKKNDGLMEEVNKLKDAIKKVTKLLTESRNEATTLRESALKIVKRREELGDYKKDEISDADLADDAIFEKAKLEKATLDLNATQEEETPVVGEKKSDDGVSKTSKDIDLYLAKKYEKNQKELKDNGINVE